MAKISELRQRAAYNKKAVEERVKTAAIDALNSESFNLTVLNQGTDSSEGDILRVANSIASKVAEVVSDPVNEFLDICKARGVKDKKIVRLVNDINDLFGLSSSEDYKEVLSAVALYLRARPYLYEDLHRLQ